MRATAATLGCAVLAVTVVAAQWLIDPAADASFDAPKRLATLVGLAIAAVATAALPRPFADRGRSAFARAVAALVGLAALAVVVAATASPRSSVSLDALRRLGLVALALPIGASALLDGAGRPWIARAFVAAATGNAILAILERAVGFTPFEVRSLTGRGGPGALVGNEGQLAVVLAFAAVATAGVVAHASRPRVLHLMVLAILLVGVTVAGNLTALMAVVAGSTTVLALRLRRRALGPLAALALAAVLALLAAPPLRARAGEAVRNLRAGRLDALTSNRLGPWAAAAEMARARPLVGFGPGTFEAEFVPHRLRAEMRRRTRLTTPVLASSYGQAHSEPLQATAEWGVVGGGSAAAAVLLLLVAVIRRARDARDEELLVLSGVLVAVAVAALTWFPFQQVSTGAAVLLAFGRAWRRLG